MKQDRSAWPQCLLWHGWPPGLSHRQFGTPWAVASGDLAINNLESSLGAYPLHGDAACCPYSDPHDVLDMINDVPDIPTFGRMAGWILSLTLIYKLLEAGSSLMLLRVFLIPGGAMRRIQMGDPVVAQHIYAAISTSSLRLIVDHAFMPSSLGFSDRSWCSLSSLPITLEDVGGWPCSVNILIEFISPFCPPSVGLKERRIWVNLVSLTQSYLSCLAKYWAIFGHVDPLSV